MRRRPAEIIEHPAVLLLIIAAGCYVLWLRALA